MLKKTSNNISINWYLRPFNIEWFDKDNFSLEDLFKHVSSEYGEYIDSIIPGGLRWTEGIEYGICEARNLELPNLLKENNVKTMEDSIWDELYKLREQYFPTIPLYRHSSCGVSHALQRDNICLTQILKKSDCNLSLCPIAQRGLCSGRKFDLDQIYQLNQKLDLTGFGITIDSIDEINGKVKTTPPLKTFSPALETAVIHSIANGI